MSSNNYLFNAWKTCLEIIKDRGYEPDTAYSNLSETDLEYLTVENKLDIVSKNEEMKKIICIKFITTEKVKSAYIKELAKEIKNNIPDCYTLEMIFVLKNKPNSSVKKLQKDPSLGDIQVRTCKELQINITKHKWVPQHIKLEQDEINQLMEQYSLKSKNQLPILLQSDAIARYFNFKSGDVIKIPTSNGSLNTRYVNYRCVK